MEALGQLSIKSTILMLINFIIALIGTPIDDINHMVSLVLVSFTLWDKYF